MIHIIPNMKIQYPKKIDASHISVKLQPILGIKPEKYIPIFYSVILVLVLFLLTILPGLIKNGTYLTITSSPQGSSVYIDGTRVGSTPVTFFVKKGNREIVIKNNFFETLESQEEIKGRVFLSTIFKRKESKHYTLKSSYGDEILSNGYNELSKWALNPTMDRRFKTPNILSKSVEKYLQSGASDKDKLDSFLKASRKLVTSKEIFSDYLRALAIKNSNGKGLTPGTLKKSLVEISTYLKESPNLELFIYSKILPPKEDYKERVATLKKRSQKILDSSATSYESSISNRRVGPYTYQYIPRGEFTPLASANFIHIIKEEPFYISKSMVSVKEYGKFLEDNPKWKRDNLENLIAQKLVDREYLEASPEDYITNISYYAAIEWIKWANDQYNIPTGYRLALATESQWLSAKNYGVIESVEAWSWSSQGFYLYDHYLADENGQFINEFDLIEPRLVLGSNKYSQDKKQERGVQKANWCSPFLGIRPVLVKDENNG